jgi:hypothetical protein
MIDEAFERCKIDPSTLDIAHILSARRSINFMLSEWSTDDRHDFRVDRLSAFPLVQGTQQYTVDPSVDGRVIDILSMSLRRAGSDTAMWPMSRQEWMDIPIKTTQGRPSRYFADKRQNSVIISLWPIPENSTDTLLMDVMRKFTDAGTAGNNPDIPYYMREAFAAGLAAKLGEKYAPESFLPRLIGRAIETLKAADASQRVLGDVRIVPGSNYRGRRGGRVR